MVVGVGECGGGVVAGEGGVGGYGGEGAGAGLDVGLGDVVVEGVVEDSGFCGGLGVGVGDWCCVWW